MAKQNEPKRAEGHEVARLVAWDSKTFTWRCECGHTNVESYSVDPGKDVDGNDLDPIGAATPGLCEHEGAQ